jgi:heme exporter protein A
MSRIQNHEELDVIAVHKLYKRFGLKTVLRGLEFNVEQGEFVALLGPNGAGKTTFLRILASLSRPASGEVRVAGHRLPQQAAAVRSRLGVVSHLPLLYGDLTAEENLRFYGRMYGVIGLERRVGEVLEMIGLAKRRRDLTRTFSRGMQQRLAIGRAVLHDPEVMLFDEPHTGLDQEACLMLDNVLREVAARGRTVVMTSHDLARAADLASRFDVLSRGVIVASIERADLAQDALLAFYRQALESTERNPAEARSIPAGRAGAGHGI